METRIDPLLKAEQFIYDRAGNLFQHPAGAERGVGPPRATGVGARGRSPRSDLDRRGQATTYRYDGLDRLTSATYADGSTSAYTYDAGNRLRTVVDSLSGTITLDYDDLDRLTSETALRGTVTYGYDDAGRRTSMTVAGQAAVTYGYDDADRLTTITQGATVVTFEYDTADRRTAVVLPNGVQVEYEYTAASQLGNLTYKLGQTVLGTLTYTYDAAGRRETVTGTWARTQLPGVLTSATYDAANRLTAWNGSTLTYDDNGNPLTEGTRSYGWDARNRLSAVGGLQPATFVYDPFGRRIAKAVAGGTTEYLYDGVEALQELAGGTPTANLLYGPGIDELLRRTDSAGARWLVADGLGSALALLDPAGVVRTEYTYEAFGTTTATGEASANAVQFTGRENDGTGLYYYRARYYSPRLQRFVSEDPIGFEGGDPNLFSYVGGQPTGLTDPLGLSGEVTNSIGGASGGFGWGLLDALRNWNKPTASGQARLGQPNPNSRMGWDRSFHLDCDRFNPNPHFNAESGHSPDSTTGPCRAGRIPLAQPTRYAPSDVPALVPELSWTRTTLQRPADMIEGGHSVGHSGGGAGRTSARRLAR